MNHPQTDWQIHQTNLSSRFKELYLNNQWTDCAFRVGLTHSEVLRGHKVVLAASSPVFETLFYGTLAAKNEIIDVPDLEPDIFQLLLKYIYCDSTEVDSIDSAGHLLYAAKKYMIPHLARTCLDFLLEHTYIHTLWDVLAVAEDLHEDELLSACTKVMCQYPGEMWVNNSEHLGLVTLSKLLDQPSTNLLESELWQLTVAWAADQCVQRNLAPSGANKRMLINQAGVLCKIRFLTLTIQEISEVVEPSGVLSEEELRALRVSVGVNATDTNHFSAVSEVILPASFNLTRETRKRFMAISSRCSRHCLSKRKRYTYGGTIKSKISTDSRVLVTGFEVFTRIASPADFIMSHGYVNQYFEDLVVTVCDEKGNHINRTEVTGIAAVFNVTQVISLSEPVWFLPEKEYTVAFVLSQGQYPLSDLSSIALSKSVCFRFSQCEDCEDHDAVDLNVSFINGLFFNV